jgi:hypothetical protein
MQEPLNLLKKLHIAELHGIYLSRQVDKSTFRYIHLEKHRRTKHQAMKSLDIPINSL